MPFPLAHPAAVLPLRRFCPRWLSFPALVIGSLSPDLGYCFGPLHVEELSHQFLGGLGFSLPVGLLILLVFRAVRSRVVEILPARWRPPLRVLCQRPLGTPAALVASLLIGAITHLLWDSLTHKGGWIVQQIAVLQIPLAPVMSRTLRVHHLLWYICTFVGVAWVCLRCDRWLVRATGAAGVVPGRAGWGVGILGGLLVLPVAAVHHLLPRSVGLPLTLAIMLFFVAGVWWRQGRLARSGSSEP
jgi:hypothetical protein